MDENICAKTFRTKNEIHICTPIWGLNHFRTVLNAESLVGTRWSKSSISPCCGSCMGWLLRNRVTFFFSPTDMIFFFFLSDTCFDYKRLEEDAFCLLCSDILFFFFVSLLRWGWFLSIHVIIILMPHLENLTHAREEDEDDAGVGKKMLQSFFIIIITFLFFNNKGISYGKIHISYRRF